METDMEKENKYRGVTTLVIVLAITFFVVLETKLLVGGSTNEPELGANGYVAGEYIGMGTGNNGPIKVKVIFSDTEILSVEVIEHGETVGIYEPAVEKVPAAIVTEQNYDVDGVSGATMTSDGIMKAVKNAMEQAAK